MVLKDTPPPAIGVLDVDGLHLPGRSVVPIQGAIRHVGDLYKGPFTNNVFAFRAVLRVIGGKI